MAIEDFAAAMAAAGVPCPVTPRPTGRMETFTVVGDRPKKDSGWYVLSENAGRMYGVFGCCKRYGTESITWQSDGPALSSEERARILHQAEIARAAREAERERRHQQAEYRAARIWDEATPTPVHEYLTRKRVHSHGLRVANWYRYIPERRLRVTIPAALIIPMYQTRGELVSLQAIFRDDHNALGRDRDFLPGGRRHGVYYRLGERSDIVVICEGYATAATVYEVTGYTTVIAFTAGNLRAVAEKIRGWLPHSEIILAADNDAYVTQPVENPGVHYATIAAHAVGGMIAVPRFEGQMREQSDFNDLMVSESPAEVAHQINNAVTP